jgi:glycosyltransferase involved in cell wall biosynthesis
MPIMTHRPLVSIVLPILNERPYIRAALDSLLTQDYSPVEVVVYDGGSTDGTLEVLRSYPIEVIVEPGLGQMAAINRGWRRTHADFVTWMAGDDLYRPGAIRRLAEELEANAEVGFVYADAEIIDGDANLIKHAKPGKITLRDLAIEFKIVPQATLIRRAALARAGMMDENQRFAADWDLFLRLAQYHTGRYVPFTAAARRLHESSEDVQNLEQVGQACIRVVERFFERSDLTNEQRALLPCGVAGARLTAGSYYCLSGKRRRAWRMFIEAGLAAPRLLLTRRATRLMARLLLPFNYPPPWSRARGRTKLASPA